MADLQAELARFEAELAQDSAQKRAAGPPPGPPPRPAGVPGHSFPHQRPPGPPGSQPWNHAPQHNVFPPSGPGPSSNYGMHHAAQAYAPPGQPSHSDYFAAAQIAQPPQLNYHAAAQPAAKAAFQPGVVQPDASKAALLSGIKEAFANQKVSKKPKYGVAREAAGKKWIDPNMLEWPENDFRIFVGDLGNETNDEVLQKAFAKYPTFQKAKVIRDKKNNKTRGFGFVSFSDTIEGAKALREMDGKYIGNRPCKLRKSTMEERNQAEQRFMPGGKKKNNNHLGVRKPSGVLHK